jgi:hypothetical protein
MPTSAANMIHISYLFVHLSYTWTPRLPSPQSSNLWSSDNTPSLPTFRFTALHTPTLLPALPSIIKLINVRVVVIQSPSILNVVMLSVVMLNVVMLSLVKLVDVILSLVMTILIFSASENEEPDVLLQVDLQVPML